MTHTGIGVYVLLDYILVLQQKEYPVRLFTTGAPVAKRFRSMLTPFWNVF